MLIKNSQKKQAEVDELALGFCSVVTFCQAVDFVVMLFYSYLHIRHVVLLFNINMLFDLDA